MGGVRSGGSACAMRMYKEREDGFVRVEGERPLVTAGRPSTASSSITCSTNDRETPTGHGA